jgi:glycerol uptake facilitator-like aquaporin
MRAALLAEGLGTGLLVAIVLGSGLMGEQLAGGNAAVALLANTGATVAGLYLLIGLFGPISGAHFNPLVSAAMAWRGALPRTLLLPYLLAQGLGAWLGALLTNAMFSQPLLQWAGKPRDGAALWLSEVVATALLLLVVLRTPAAQAPARVAACIGAAYWFTASTSFANPAVSFGRMFSEGFAGIAPASVPAFVLAQTLGAGLALVLNRLLDPAQAATDRSS